MLCSENSFPRAKSGEGFDPGAIQINKGGGLIGFDLILFWGSLWAVVCVCVCLWRKPWPRLKTMAKLPLISMKPGFRPQCVYCVCLEEVYFRKPSQWPLLIFIFRFPPLATATLKVGSRGLHRAGFPGTYDLPPIRRPSWLLKTFAYQCLCEQ